jgi:SAM-dependent methyltransferase
LIVNNLIDFIKLKIIFDLKSKKDLSNLTKQIDTGSINRIQNKYKNLKNEQFKAKYLDIKKYLPKNLKRGYKLNIHNSHPLNILDIGSGPGYFCYICNYFGHKTTALDIGGNPIFDDLVDALGINRKIEKVEAFKKLPKSSEKFDLITAFYAPFNRSKTFDKVWRIDEWKFFLEDLANNLLNKNGRALFYLQPENTGNHYNRDLLNYFLNLDTNVFGEELYFRSFEKIKS